MRQLKLVICGLLCLSLQLVASTTNAGVYYIEYSGVINTLQGDGLGFSIGDEVSGHMRFDLANATPDQFLQTDFAVYRSKPGRDLVTSENHPDIGDIPGTSGENWDQVGVSNQYASGIGDRTYIYVNDIFHGDDPWNTFGMSIAVILNGLDWLDNDNLNEFDFTSSSPFFNSLDSYGHFANITSYLAADGQNWAVPNTADFKLNHVKMTKISDPIAVPEPGSWMLMMTFLASLLMLRVKAGFR